MLAVLSSVTGLPAASERLILAAPAGSTPIHACVGPQRLDGSRNARQQPAAADGHVDLVHVGAVLDDLEADRSLAGDDPGVVERRYHDEPARVLQCARLRTCALRMSCRRRPRRRRTRVCR